MFKHALINMTLVAEGEQELLGNHLIFKSF